MSNDGIRHFLDLIDIGSDDLRGIVAAALAEGLLLVTGGDNVVRLLPPLIVDDAEVDEAVARLDRALAGMTRRAAAE